MPNFETMHFGDHRVAASRYRKFVVENGGKVMHVLLDGPREAVRIDGNDNVAAAIHEIESCFEMSDDGWRDFGS